MAKKQLEELRSKIMRSVRSKNTGAELMVRKILRDMGYLYYRLHVKTLPGSPDIVFRKLKRVIFVNGCFWHGHNCSKGRLPKSNISFWEEKVIRNRARDKQNYTRLSKTDWKYLVIWQCELKRPELLKKRIKSFISKDV